MRKQNGITLIALVITIIVLLILAGVSISAVIGENGIVERSKKAKENTRAAYMQEQIGLALDENEIQEKTEKEDYITKEELIVKLFEEGKLTEEETKVLETEDKVTIGEKEVDFSELVKYSITFTISGKEYYAELDMTWEDWIQSSYNTGGFRVDGYRNVLDEKGEYWVYYYNKQVKAKELIVDGRNYSLYLYGSDGWF